MKGETVEAGESPVPERELADLKLKVEPDLCRAFRRASWIITHETGRDQIDIAREMIKDFLVKHGC
ncbi:MAG: hypothetical protein ABFR97_03765 [Thermodesulfobacteriota bacterium]